MDDPMKKVADALNDHQITDDDGLLNKADDTAEEKSTTPETNTVDDTASSEKSAEAESTAPKAEEEVTEPNFAEDEAGRRYVPEKRFKEVYAKQKETERLLAAEKANRSQGVSQQTVLPQQPQVANQGVDRNTAVELDLLKLALPQFNPDSTEYDPELDKLGAQIYSANPGITMTEAGRRALATAKALTSKQAQVVAEARAVKSQQSDQGITSRVRSNGAAETPDPDKMSLEQMEDYLKSNGQW